MKKYRKPYRIKKRKPIWKTKLFWRIFVALLFLGEIVYSIYFLVPFQIKEIKITGNEKVKTADIEGIIRNQTNKRILFFQTKSIFLVDSRAIEKTTLAEFPQIEKTTLRRDFFSSLAAEIKERKPAAVFVRGEQKFYIDKEGVVFESITGESQLLKIAVESSPLPNLGQNILEKKLMAVILEIQNKMKNELKIPITEILIVSEEKLNVKTTEGWEIYFNPRKDVGWQLTKLKAVLEKEISADRRKNLDYIDLRFGNLAPYKYR